MKSAKELTGYTEHIPLHMLLCVLLGFNGYTIQLLDQAGYGNHMVNEVTSYMIVVLIAVVVIRGVAPYLFDIMSDWRKGGETA